MVAEVIGSSPVVGSSKSTASGSSASERASAARLRIPPESSEGILLLGALQAHQLELLAHRGADLAPALPGVLAQREGDVVEHRHRIEQRAALEEHRHPPPQRRQLLLVERVDLDAVEHDAAGVGRLEAVEQAQEHALAGARAAEDHQHSPRRTSKSTPLSTARPA